MGLFSDNLTRLNLVSLLKQLWPINEKSQNLFKRFVKGAGMWCILAEWKCDLSICRVEVLLLNFLLKNVKSTVLKKNTMNTHIHLSNSSNVTILPYFFLSFLPLLFLLDYLNIPDMLTLNN